MFLLWVILFLLHQGHTLVPVVTVQLGEPVTLTCAFSVKYQSTTWLHWYKQSSGDTLKLIVMQQKTIEPKYEPEVSASRIKATNDDKFSNLTILRTVLQDEGMYHCAHMDWTESTWTGTYLLVKENSGRTSSYTVLQNPVSDRAHPANSETLQCSVLSESEGKLCSGELSVFWFRAGSGQSYPEIIHTNEKGPHNCENTSSLNTQKKCTYSLSKNLSSSGTDTLYCAVATCGEILFGKGTKTNAGPSFRSQETIISIIPLSAALVISLTGMAVLLCSINRCKCEYHQDAVNLEKNCGQNSQQADEDRRMYSAVIFTMMKTDTETQMMFAAVKPFSL